VVRPFVCIRMEGGSAEARERAIAEAYAAGAVGCEERDGPPPKVLLFAPAACGAALVAALEGCTADGLRVAAPEAVAPVDWSEAWREGLAPVRVSARLVVRPSFVSCDAANAAQVEIDPGQAFGTGGHGSTLRALEWIDRLAEGPLAGARFVDVGCGSGVLALAALALGAGSAVGCDLDPLAAQATRANARVNHLSERLGVFVGSVGALRAGSFDVAAANLLRSELLPVLRGLLAALRPGGSLILSGLLAEERPQVEARLGALGAVVRGAHAEMDATGDAWLGLWVVRDGGVPA